MKKVNIIFLITIVVQFSVFAQNIELPDVTTVIQGENIQVDSSALPDFNDLFEAPKGSGSIVPQLPDINTSVAPVNSSEKKNGEEKSVFSEILVGGGYPFLFYGNCTVSNTKKNSPFKLAFSYDAANGYEGKPLTENYSDSKINLFVEKKFFKNNLSLDFSTSYDFKSNGLQNKVLDISEINNFIIAGNGNVDYKFSNGISIGTNISLDFYNRYASMTDKNQAVDPLENWVKKSALLTFIPTVYGKWSGKGFDVLLEGEYLLDGKLFNDIEGGSTNRGSFIADVKWHNDIFNLFGNVGVVFGSQLNNNSVLVPFSAGFNIMVPVYFSDRRVCIAGEGGLSSIYNTVASLEKKYDFAGFSSMPAETAEWYGKLKLDIPLKTVFTGNLSAEYRHTAFNNSIWEPDYSENNFTDGLYKFTGKNRKYFATDLSLTFHHKFFTINGGWHANWLDVPVMESMQMFNVNMSFQAEDSKWGAGISGSYNIDSNWQLPVISLDGFYQVSSTARISASFDNIISLFNSNTGNNPGKYINRGFTGSLFIKFVL